MKEADPVIEAEDKTQAKEQERDASKSGDFSNPIVILKRRLHKIIETNKEKRKLMD